MVKYAHHLNEKSKILATQSQKKIFQPFFVRKRANFLCHKVIVAYSSPPFRPSLEEKYSTFWIIFASQKKTTVKIESSLNIYI